MYVTQLQASMAKYEANELMKKYDRKSDHVLAKEEQVDFFIHAARGSTQLNNQGTVLKIPKANNVVVYKLSSNAHVKSNKKLDDKAQKSSTSVPSGMTSNGPVSRQQIKEIFKYHNSDKDNFIDIKERTKAFRFLDSTLPFYKAHYGLAHTNANKDGFISEAELDKLINHTNKIINKKRP